MNRSQQVIASSAGLVLLTAVVVASFVLVGGAAVVPPQTANAQTTSIPSATSTVTPATASTVDPAVAQPAVVMSADFVVSYTSLAQLRRAARVIVRGTVTDTSYLDFNTITYTKVTFKVAKCYKGDVAAGDSITLVEVGGVTTGAAIVGDKFGGPTKEDYDTKVTVQLEGAPLTQVGDECLYFLGGGSIGVVPGTYYDPIGAFQGHFKITNGVARRFVPEDALSGDYTSLAVDESAIANTMSHAAAE